MYISLVILVFECILASRYSFNVCTCAGIEHVNYDKMAVKCGGVSCIVLPVFYTSKVLV